MIMDFSWSFRHERLLTLETEAHVDRLKRAKSWLKYFLANCVLFIDLNEFLFTEYPSIIDGEDENQCLLYKFFEGFESIKQENPQIKRKQ